LINSAPVSFCTGRRRPAFFIFVVSQVCSPARCLLHYTWPENVQIRDVPNFTRISISKKFNQSFFRQQLIYSPLCLSSPSYDVLKRFGLVLKIQS